MSTNERTQENNGDLEAKMKEVDANLLIRPQTVVNDLAKRLIATSTDDLIGKIDLEEAAESWQTTSVTGVMMAGNKIFYCFQGYMTRKQFATFIVSLAPLIWLIKHYILPFLTSL